MREIWVSQELAANEGQLYTYQYTTGLGAGQLNYVKVWLRDRNGVKRKHYDSKGRFLFEDYLRIPKGYDD